MTRAPIYDRIGRGYAQRRQPDPRIAARVARALGDARTIVNVGAGSGSYEPEDRQVVAVEPSEVMITQRPREAAPVVRAVAESLPFESSQFDAALAVLTVHHWTDAKRGLAELRRVARRQVIFTWDPKHLARFWFTRDYLPEAVALDAGFTTLEPTMALLGAATVEPIPVPHDCQDGFFAAYWRRPEAYFDPDVRAGISGFGILEQSMVEHALQLLADDLATGEWYRRNEQLLELDEIDLGYRLIVAGSDQS
jgi:SAM-dependent methyltransferase